MPRQVDTAALHRNACGTLALKGSVIDLAHTLLSTRYGLGGASLVTGAMTLGSQRRATDLGEGPVLGRVLATAGAQARAMDENHRQGAGLDLG